MRARLLFPLPLLLLLSGCSYFRQKAAERYVYVTARQTYLRDRVAAVSNRTGSASNGEKLVVLERARRFLKVRTPRGEVGWIEEKLTADQHTADEFEALRTDHENDPVVAAAAARDEVYLHIAPGRETERFYRLAEGDQVNLLERATVAKVSSDKPSPAAKPPAKPVPAATPPATPAATSAQPIPPAKSPADGPDADTPAVPAPPPAMEDWWLVRDSKGQTGWLYSRMIDVAEPDVLSRYSEGQRIVGAYILDHANDPDSGVLDNGVVVTSIPEYVTVLSPYKAGLPYDFDQVRVFIWNTRKHRYETSFRERNIVGYLPVQIALKTDPYVNTPLGHTPLPSFTYRVLSADSPIPTPDTQPPAEAHPVPDAPKDKGKGKHKHKP
jgi:SH3-like domain-containing protein